MMATFISLLLAIMARLPLSLARGLGWLVGEWAWLSRSRGARTAQSNLAACFPGMGDAQRRCLARTSMHHWGMTVFEIPIVWRKGRHSLDYIRRVKGRDLIEAALARGRGVILLSPHLGNWELTGLWIGSFGPTTTMYQPPRRQEVEEPVRDARSKTGAILVPTDRRGIARLKNALERRQIIGILPDMEPPSRAGVFAPFFGVPALTMTLPHSLQQRTGAEIVIGFCQRIPGGFEARFTRPDPAIYASAPETYAAALNRSIESLVNSAPEQYQWEYKRFKKRPPGEAPLYPKGRARFRRVGATS